MHEYSIVQALIERVREEVVSRGASRAVRVWVRLGEMSGVDPGLLATAYETFRDRTVCAGAPLELERVSAQWACPRCQRPVSRGLRCEGCNGPATMVSGDEILLGRLELEVPDV